MNQNRVNPHSSFQSHVMIWHWFKQLYWFLASASSGEPTCPNPNGEFAYAHPEICDQFWLCVNGTISLETCGNGLLFDGKGAVHNHCNYNWAVDCGDRVLDRK
jgi:hypothetical protein